MQITKQFAQQSKEIILTYIRMVSTKTSVSYYCLSINSKDYRAPKSWSVKQECCMGTNSAHNCFIIQLILMVICTDQLFHQKGSLLNWRPVNFPISAQVLYLVIKQSKHFVTFFLGHQSKDWGIKAIVANKQFAS